MIFSLLGDVTAEKDGIRVVLPAGKLRAVLAALLLNANKIVSKEALLRAVWGADPPDPIQLQKHISKIRGLFDWDDQTGPLRTHLNVGYELKVAPDDLDMLVFDQLVAGAYSGDDAGRLESLRTALRLWHDARPLANLPEDLFRVEVDNLQNRRRRAATHLFALELARGGADRILDEIRVVAALFPADRELCRQLMAAAYRCGNTQEATDTFERYRDVVDKPDPSLRQLAYAMVRGDVEAVEAAIPYGPSPAVSSLVPRQLPTDPALVGRDPLTAETTWYVTRDRDRVRATPVVVIVGPGGIGKTALAVHAANACQEDFPDGQLYAEMRGTAGPPVPSSEIIAQFLRAFGVGVPEAQAERVTTYRSLLAERRVLIVLDDATNDAEVAELVPGGRGCAVIVTSRGRLPAIENCHHPAPLGPLTDRDATGLFLRTVRGSRIDLTAEMDAVARVVGLCAGLPLALRVAAALRVESHPRPTRELADLLERHGTDGLVYGELSVARTIGAGFDRLPDDGCRRLFLGLGLLRIPGFGRWTAAALMPPDTGDPAASLSRLTAVHLVEPAGAGPRYQLHDLTRDYAARRARTEFAADEVAAIPERAYQGLLTLLRRAHAGLYGGDYELVHSAVPDWAVPPAVAAEVSDDPVAWFDSVRVDVRAAVEHCAELGLTGICWDLAVSAHEFYTIGGHFDDWYVTHRVALDACRRAGDGRGEGILLACLGQPALVASRPAEAVSGVAELRRAVNLLAAAGDRHGTAIAMRTLANALRRGGRLAEPLALFHEALEGYRTAGDEVGQHQTARFIGQTYLDQGRLDDALHNLVQARSLARRLRNERLVAQSCYWIGLALIEAGRDTEAEAACGETYRLFADVPGVGHAYGSHGLGEVALRQGRRADAERWFDMAVELARVGGDAVLEGRVRLSQARLYQAQDMPAEATAVLRDAVAVFAAVDATYLRIRALAALGDEEQVEELYRIGGVPEADQIHRRFRWCASTAG